MWFVLALSVAVAAYNNVVNRWRPFHGAAYVPVNLIFAGTITIAAAATLELTRAELGLQGDIRDAAVPFAGVAGFTAAMFFLAHSRHADRIADRRVLGLRGRALAFYVLARIPLGTAVTEEVVFRGALFAAWRDTGASTLLSAACASVAFGLWHISPTIIGVRTNDPTASATKLRVAALAAALATTIAGLGLTWLRLRSGSLIGPIVLHAGINSVSALAAVSAGRREAVRRKG